VVVYGDGGGRVSPSWPRPIFGRDRVVRLFAAMGVQLVDLGLSIQRHEVNGQPGATVVDREGRVANVFSLDIVDGVIQTIRSVINPDKLRHLGPLADVQGILQAAREERRNST
jgi:RNA polymerase sigma-70 factor (ECF subfamily)